MEDEISTEYEMDGDVMVFKENDMYNLCPLEEDLW